MDIQATKIELVRQLLNVKKESVLLKIQAMLRKEQSVDELESLTLQQYIESIKEADAQIDRGEYKTIESFEADSAKWR